MINKKPALTRGDCTHGIWRKCTPPLQHRGLPASASKRTFIAVRLQSKRNRPGECAASARKSVGRGLACCMHQGGSAAACAPYTGLVPTLRVW